MFAFSILSCSKKEEIISPDSIYNLGSVWEKQDGSKISFIDLKGKVIVTTMIFTSCKTACPRLTAEMKKIAKEVGKVDPDNIEYLLISIDPKTDTPEVMKAYLKTHQLDEKEWMFIRSNENDTREIANIMAVKYKEISPIEFSHSNIISVYSKKVHWLTRKKALITIFNALQKKLKSN